MRVLFITGEFPPMPGGVGDCTHEIAKELARQGVAVGVLTTTRAAKFQARNAPFKFYPRVANWDWASWRTLATVIREFGAEVAHVQYQTGAFGMHPAIDFAPRFLAAHLAKNFRGTEPGSGVRFVTTFHDLRPPYLFPKAGRIREWVTRELACASAAAIATNDADSARLATWRVRRGALIPIGSNVTTTPPPDYDRAAWRARLGVHPAEMLIGYFGFLNASKGGETLVRALAQIADAKLVMIGGQTGASDPTDAAYLARVKNLIADLGLGARVIWTEHAAAEIVSAHFRATDVCALPYCDGASYRRGTLMAALAHGCAIITTRAANAPASEPVRLPALRAGENCLLVPPNDPGALAAELERARHAPALRAQIGAGALALAQHFTWDQIARQHLDLYRKIGVATA